MYSIIMITNNQNYYNNLIKLIIIAIVFFQIYGVLGFWGDRKSVV